MKNRLFGLAIVALSFFASCSDDDIVANVTLPAEIEHSQATGLESYSYTIPFEVKSDTEWKIEFDETGEEIAYVHPASGKGNATIQLYILDNLNNESRQGNMTIVFPENTKKNKVVTLKQKAKNGSDENFSTETVGNITYGVGYGFNVVTGIGPRSIKAQIIKAQLLTEENLVQKAATSTSSVDYHTYTGSTVKELSNNFSSSFDFSAGGWGIEAEANSKFDVNSYNKDEFQYAMSFVDVSKEQITITLNEDEWAEWDDLEEGCYTRAAYKAINGENRKYPSNDAGFKKLFDSYGTHVIRTATLGGRLTIATTVNTSEISKEYNLEAFAKMSYSGIIDVSAEVNDEYKNSFNENASACQTKITALGGSSAIFSDLSDLVGDGAKNAANDWFGSLNEYESSWTFIGLDDMDNLIPLWELVEDTERAELMQEYFESGQYAEDTNKGLVYDLGVQAYLATGVDEFEPNGTQIMDVKIGENNNKTVARICNEFIPQLNEKEPVKVIYPVVNGKIKWNMGWFVGNSIYPPHRVVNVDGKIKVEAIRNENEKGEASEIYIRGIRIGSTPVDEETKPQTATPVPFYAEMPRGNKQGNYSVVKILDKIWINENYAGTVYYDSRKEIKGYYGTLPVLNDPARTFKPGDYYYYDYKFWEEDKCGDGWYVLKADSFKDVIEMLKQYNINVTEAFSAGGCLGFNAQPTGYSLIQNKDGHLFEDWARFHHIVSKQTSNTVDVFYLDDFNGTYDTNRKVTNTSVYYDTNKLSTIHTPIRCYKPIQ